MSWRKAGKERQREAGRARETEEEGGRGYCSLSSLPPLLLQAAFLHLGSHGLLAQPSLMHDQLCLLLLLHLHHEQQLLLQHPLWATAAAAAPL